MTAGAERLSKSALSHGHDSGALESSQGNPLNIVCAACRAGPFSYDGFRKAIAKDLGHYANTTGYCYTRTWCEISLSIDEKGCIVKRTRDALPSDKYPYGKKEVEVRVQIAVSSIQRNVDILLDGEKAAHYTIYANKNDSAVEELKEEKIFSPKEPFTDFQKVIECVKKCSHHEHCPPLEETRLPTRVIDCSDPTKPRLFETNRKIMGHYCTLSYVWGGDQPQKTTKANIHKYVNEGINVPLPQMIADAVTVTHKLGLQYLWVDALCIIQDSEEDKIKELGIMGHIYRRAYLTISVLSAYRADEGFLPEERPPDVLPFYLLNRPQSPSRMVAEYYIPRQRGSKQFETVRSHNPLDKRGWCFQESMLSARTLIFQPPSVRYKCRSFQELEIGRPHPVADNVLHKKRKASPANDYSLFPVEGRHNNATPSTEDLNELWQKTLWNYSMREVTASSDKFAALASIVEVFQFVIVDDQYIAGLWRKNLLYDLHWQVLAPAGPDGPRPRPKGYRAPTWSWATVDGELDTELLDPDPPSEAAIYEAEILSYEVTPKTLEFPLGELVDGRLVIRAKICPLMRNGEKCVFIEDQGAQEGDGVGRYYTTWSWYPPFGNCFEAVGSPDAEKDEDEDEKERIEGITFDCLEGTEQDQPLDFYVVILRAGREYKNQGDWMSGLLLLHVEGEVEQYRRAGFLDLQYDFEWPDWFDDAALKTIVLV